MQVLTIAVALHFSILTEFTGCPYETDDVWGIIWPNTPGGTVNTQPCPGGVDAVGMTPL